LLKPAAIEPLSGKPRLKVWAIGLLSGLLLTFSQPPASLPVLGFIALAPMLLALPRLSAGGAFLMGTLVSLPYFWVNMWWLGQMVTDPGNEWIVFGMFMFVATAMALYYGVAAMVMRWILTRRVLWLIWLVPLAWLGFEFIHELDTPVPYPWLPLATSVVDLTWFVQTADIWGYYGISATLAFTALALVAPFEFKGTDAKLGLRACRMRRIAMPSAALALVILSCVYGAVRVAQMDARATGDGPVVALVQGNLAQEVKVRDDPQRIPRSFEEHLELSRQGVHAGAELVAWAETMVPYGATRDGLNRWAPETSAQFFDDGVPARRLLTGQADLPGGRSYNATYIEILRAEIAHRLHTPMLVGVITTVPKHEQIHDWKDYSHRAYNTAMHIDAQGRVVATYDKRFLVPGGEYIPLESLEIFGWAPVHDLVVKYAEGLQGYASRVEPGMRLTRFSLPSKAERLEGRDWRYTSSICYEFAWALAYLDLHRNADQYPDFHINISNEGWFKYSAELDQAVDFCRLRAIESRVPMLRATNTGITCSIDASGRVVDILTVNGQDREVQGLLLTRPVVLSDPSPTVFVRWVGRGPGWISLLLIVSMICLMTAGRVQERRQRKAAKATPAPEETT
jgi:apolipoprotein N-acyltransferase